MTPKEKAIDLTADFYNIKSNEPDYGMEWEMAKKCALIAVDEILNIIPCYEEYGSNGWVLIDNSEYWEEVKKEIEKL